MGRETCATGSTGFLVGDSGCGRGGGVDKDGPRDTS